MKFMAHYSCSWSHYSVNLFWIGCTLTQPGKLGEDLPVNFSRAAPCSCWLCHSQEPPASHIPKHLKVWVCSVSCCVHWTSSRSHWLQLSPIVGCSVFKFLLAVFKSRGLTFCYNCSRVQEIKEKSTAESQPCRLTVDAALGEILNFSLPWFSHV